MCYEIDLKNTDKVIQTWIIDTIPLLLYQPNGLFDFGTYIFSITNIWIILHSLMY